MSRIRDWALTIPFLVAFAMTLLIFDLVARVVLLFSLRGFENVMAALQRTLVALLFISGTRVVVERSELIEDHREMSALTLQVQEQIGAGPTPGCGGRGP